MTREQAYERVNKVFRDIFDDESIIVIDTTTADNIEDWDSLEHINLIVALEEEFGMKFTMGEVIGMYNVGEAVDIITARATR
ncbi:MAG: acyl carrier protein [Clostridiales bacterium]|jgi:acyl carrier protein|nr:acyl carrier protein [Clostridiales bacterium]